MKITSAVDIRPNKGVLKFLDGIADADIKTFGDLSIEASRDECPVDTGNLKRSLEFTSTKPREVILRSRTGYGGFVHFGTARQAANPFMARGVDRATSELASMIRSRDTYRD